MILNGKIEQDIFEFNNGLDLFNISIKLIDEYGRKKASNYLWSLYLVYHPESPLYNMKLRDKKENVMKTYLKEKGSYDELLGIYVTDFIKEIVNDPVAQMLALIRIKFDEYFEAVAYLNFDVTIKEDVKLLNQVNDLQDLKGYESMIEEYDKAYKKYVEKKDEGKLYKNIKESFREKRLREGKK